MSGPSPVITPDSSYSPASASGMGVPKPEAPAQNGLGTPNGASPAPIPPKSGITELFGTILIVVGILVFLALLSFQMDLSEGGTPSPGTNLIGTVGHYAASMLFYLFGKSAFLAGPWLFLLGGLTIYRGGFSDPVSRLLALLTVMLGSSLLGGILWGNEGTPSEAAGGLIGLYLGGSLQTLFGFYGALILALGTFMVGLFLSIRLPMPVVWNALGEFFKSHVENFNRIFTENRYLPAKNPSLAKGALGASSQKGAAPSANGESAFSKQEDLYEEDFHTGSAGEEGFSGNAIDRNEDDFGEQAASLHDGSGRQDFFGEAERTEDTERQGSDFMNKTGEEAIIKKVKKDAAEHPPWIQKITIGEEGEGMATKGVQIEATDKGDTEADLSRGWQRSQEGFFGEGLGVPTDRHFSSEEGLRSSYPSGLPAGDSSFLEGEEEDSEAFHYDGFFADSEERFFFRKRGLGVPRPTVAASRFRCDSGVPRPSADASRFRGDLGVPSPAADASRFRGDAGVPRPSADANKEESLLRPLPEEPLASPTDRAGELPLPEDVLYRYRRRLDGRKPVSGKQDFFSQEDASTTVQSSQNETLAREPLSDATQLQEERGEAREEIEESQSIEPTREKEESETDLPSREDAKFSIPTKSPATELPDTETPDNFPDANFSTRDAGNVETEAASGSQELSKPPVSVRDILHEAIGTAAQGFSPAPSEETPEISAKEETLDLELRNLEIQAGPSETPPKDPYKESYETEVPVPSEEEDLPPLSVRDGANKTVAEPRRKKPEKSLVPELALEKEHYFIPTDILRPAKRLSLQQIEEDIELTKLRLEQVFADYRIPARVVRTQRGPIITLYEIKLEPGTKVARISGIHDEIKMHLEAQSIRIIAPIPGRPTVGIEIPNRKRQPVSLREMLAERPPRTDGLSIVFGANIKGKKIFGDLTKLPHLLIAGATGSGKSVYMNSVIASLLCNYSPEDLRFIMIDPKMVELRLFEGIPHLLMPVITDVRRANKALTWAVMEMERRYAILSALKSRDIRSYNERIAAREARGQDGAKKMPYIVVLIDELADLMMVAAKDVEDSIIRLTQKARAVGIHLVMATQRPSVDVITALIKANCPARIAFQVSQKTDSRTILDANGAEALLGKGDMLYRSPVSTSLERLQAPFISEEEIEELVAESRRFGTPVYVDLGEDDSEYGASEADGEAEHDLLDEAWRIIKESGKTSTSYVQRRLRIGYNRAANLIEELEERGYLGPAIGNKPREILKKD